MDYILSQTVYRSNYKQFDVARWLALKTNAFSVIPVTREVVVITCCYYAVQSFKVIDFGTSQKCVGNFLLVNNTSFYHISHRLQLLVIADHWSIFCFRRGYHLSLTHSLGMNHKLTTTKFGVKLKNLETSLYRTMRNVFGYLEPFRCGSLP